jgi:hypothetical protein
MCAICSQKKVSQPAHSLVGLESNSVFPCFENYHTKKNFTQKCINTVRRTTVNLLVIDYLVISDKYMCVLSPVYVYECQLNNVCLGSDTQNLSTYS